MGFWNTKFSESIYEINYEKLVNNKEKEVKNLLNFCDLNYEQSCLNFHQMLKTPIKTVSIIQARRPIYNNSINKNKYYENNLNRMFSLLQ